MLTNAMKYVSIVILVLTAVLWGYAPVYERVFGFIVATAAVLVAIQASRARQYR